MGISMAQVMPAFEVEKLEGTREHVILKPDKDNGGFTKETVKIDAGYNVYFPRGHSIRVSEAELQRMGLNRDPALVDMESGDGVGNASRVSLKERVSRKTKPTRSAHQE